jgi:hypothetical protein
MTLKQLPKVHDFSLKTELEQVHFMFRELQLAQG